MKYDIDNVFSWAKDYSMQKQLNEGMFIDTFIDDIISTEELEDVELEELKNMFNELVKLSSFTSRMRIKIGDIIALKVFEEMEEE
jgi:hypothetical protein